MSNSPSRGLGRGSSAVSSTSGPPKERMTTAFMPRPYPLRGYLAIGGGHHFRRRFFPTRRRALSVRRHPPPSHQPRRDDARLFGKEPRAQPMRRGAPFIAPGGEQFADRGGRLVTGGELVLPRELADEGAQPGGIVLIAERARQRLQLGADRLHRRGPGGAQQPALIIVRFHRLPPLVVLRR